MTVLSSDVRHAADHSVLCWLATVSQDGQPNVSPKEIWAIMDSEHMVVANIASPTSVRNILHSRHVCVSFIDVFVQKGFKVIGDAENIDRGHPSFQRWSAPLVPKAEPGFKIHSVIVIRARAAEPIVAPSYRLYPAETTEESQIASAHRAYGLSARTRSA